jgi:hypothetical protein
MAFGTRAKFIAAGADPAVSTIASRTNPDGSTFSLYVQPEAGNSDVGFSLTAAVGGTALPSTGCHHVVIQNRLTADDGVTAQTNSVWIVIGGVKVFELVNGQSADVYVTNANQVTVTSFAGTSLVSGTISAY